MTTMSPRLLAIGAGAALAALASSCNALLGLDDVVVLCETGADCQSGYCGSDHVCDDTQWALAIAADGGATAASMARVPADDGGEASTLVAGSFEGRLRLPDGSVLESAGGLDAFVVKIDDRGRILYAQRFGGPGDETSTSIAADRQGGAIVVGTFSEGFDFAGPLVAGIGQNGFVVRLDADGVPSAVLGFRADPFLDVQAVVEAPVSGKVDLPCAGAEAVVVAGSFRGTLVVGPMGQTALSGEFARSFAIVVGWPTLEPCFMAIASGDGNSDTCCAAYDRTFGRTVSGGSFDGDLALAATPSQRAMNYSAEGNNRDILLSVTEVGLLDGASYFIGDASDLNLEAVTPGPGGDVTYAYTALDWAEGPSAFVVTLSNGGPSARLAAPPSPQPGTFGIASLAVSGADVFAFGWFMDSLDVVGTELGFSAKPDATDLFVLSLGPAGPDRARSHTWAASEWAAPAGLAIGDRGQLIAAGSFAGRLDVNGSFGSSALVANGKPSVFIANVLP
jgi:hypothetical protein